MKRVLIFLIKFYKRKISPKKGQCCRFRPSCSTFAIGAIEKHGAFLGSLMAVCRIIRCNPMFVGGYDPVPERFTLKSGVGKYTEPSACENCEMNKVCDRQSCEVLGQANNVKE